MSVELGELIGKTPTRNGSSWKKAGHNWEKGDNKRLVGQSRSLFVSSRAAAVTVTTVNSAMPLERGNEHTVVVVDSK